MVYLEILLLLAAYRLTTLSAKYIGLARVVYSHLVCTIITIRWDVVGPKGEIDFRGCLTFPLLTA